MVQMLLDRSARSEQTLLRYCWILFPKAIAIVLRVSRRRTISMAKIAQPSGITRQS
jgi:hypothetical protein